MPGLVEGAFAEEHPVIWICSLCGEIFDLGRIVLNPSDAQKEALNERFRTHCNIVHPGAGPAIGLQIG